jgi:putative transposase
MRKTFSFKLYNSKKNKLLHERINAAASIYNHCIALHKIYFKIYGKYLNRYQLQKHITKLKKTPRYTSWRIVPSQAIQDITDRIERAYQLFFAHAKNGRIKPPTFRKRVKYASITLKQAGYKVLDGNKIKIGKENFKYFKSRETEGAIKTLTIKRDALGDINLFFSCEIKNISPCRIMTGKIAGFDFGLKTFLTSSDGTKIEAPLFFKENSKKIKKASRKVSTKKRGSNNRKKAKMHLARCHKKIAHQRKDYHVKLAQKLTQEQDHLFFEDLSINGMQRIWGRKIGDLGFSNFLSLVEYHGQCNGSQVHIIDKFYPSSKTCHVCQKIFKELSLNDRTWRCSGCRTLHDRDINAAINIKIVGASTIGLGDVRPTQIGYRCLNPESNAF